MDDTNRKLIDAAYSGNKDDVKKYLEKGADVNAVDLYGDTPLHSAARSEYGAASCELLLDAKADPNMTNKEGDTPLHDAARYGSDKSCQLLLDAKADPNTRNIQGDTPLHSAAGSIYGTASCQLLIDAKADPNMTNEKGDTPLHDAAKYCSDKSCQLLLDAKADPNTRNKQGDTPLHCAAMSRNGTASCQLLLDAKADPNMTNEKGDTPLHCAARSEYGAASCQLLLDAKADPNMTNEKGATPLHYAAENENDKLCQLLLDAKADPNTRNKQGYTPLHFAAGSIYGTASCKLLLDAKADPNMTNEKGDTPLHYAARYGNDKSCQLLLDAKAEPNTTNEQGRTSLHNACTRALINTSAIELLLHAGADKTFKDKEGKAPFDLILDKYDKAKVQKIDKRISLLRTLMEQGSRPVDVIKVFLCGDPGAGKTTIKKTLTKKWYDFAKISSKTENQEAAENYIRTPGIDVERHSVKGAGNFIFWDCAGQVEFSLTHGMFLGIGQSLFVVVYDLVKLSEGNMAPTEYWLPFIKATRSSKEKPRVVLVGSHYDVIRAQTAKRAATDLLQQARSMFGGSLDIDDEVILLNSRDSHSGGIETLKSVMKLHRNEILGKEMVPKVCDKVLKKVIHPVRNESTVPVIGWERYKMMVRQEYPGMDVGMLRSVTSYLHLMGEVYLAEFKETEDQLIVDTQWFTKNIIGTAFAGKEFALQFETLPDQPCYTLEKLGSVFTEMEDTPKLLTLLNHMDLVHETDSKNYLLPGKLPFDAPNVDWNTQNAYDVKGLSIECAENVDIFSPTVFPCLQKKILDAHRRSPLISRFAVIFSEGPITVLVQQTKHKRSINIAVSCPDKESRGACYTTMQEVRDMIMLEISERSPGTNIRQTFISQKSLRTKTNLEDVETFTKLDLTEAEREENGLVLRLGKHEEVTQILFQGYDTMFLEEFGSECRYEWLPMEILDRSTRRLDVSCDRGEDYRAVGKLLGMEAHIVEQIAEDTRRREESPTVSIIKAWCRKHDRKMTIGMLQKLFCHLSLVANEDALNAIDELLNRFKTMKPMRPAEKSTFNVSVSEHLVRWRLVLKRHWAQLKADLDPNMLTSRLTYIPPDICAIIEGADDADIRQRIKNAETLLLFLLKRDEDDWPEDFILGLQETDQRPLAAFLQEEHKKAVRESELRKERYMQILLPKSDEFVVEEQRREAAAGASWNAESYDSSQKKL